MKVANVASIAKSFPKLETAGEKKRKKIRHTSTNN